MTRMLIVIAAALALAWGPGQAARLGNNSAGLHASASLPSQTTLARDRFAGIALR